MQEVTAPNLTASGHQHPYRAGRCADRECLLGTLLSGFSRSLDLPVDSGLWALFPEHGIQPDGIMPDDDSIGVGKAHLSCWL